MKTTIFVQTLSLSAALLMGGHASLGADSLDTWATRYVADWTLNDVTYGDGLFVAAANVCYTSTDGVGWTRRAMEQPPFELRSVAYGNGRFVAVAAGAAYVSTNGIDWRYGADLPDDDPLPVVRRVVFAGGTFLVVGQEGGDRGSASHWLILTSPDGTNWSRQSGEPNGESHHLNTAAYGNGVYLAGGWVGLPTTEGLLLLSTNLTEWTSVPAPFRDIEGLSYGKGMFIAVGSGIATSSDGVHWTNQLGAIRNGFSAVTFGGDSFVAVGDSSLLMSSSDGVTWREHANRVDGLLGVTYGQGSFIAVGGFYTALPRGVALQSGGRPQVWLDPLGFGPSWDGGFQLLLRADAGRTYRLQASERWPAESWTDVTSISLPGEPGPWPFTMRLVDIWARPGEQRFYRVVSP